MLVDTSDARKLIARLGRTGAYTHDLGRYWAYRAILGWQPNCSPPWLAGTHILIDEAQDIGSVHQAIPRTAHRCRLMRDIIGDPNQGIYEFAGCRRQVPGRLPSTRRC